MTELTGTIGCVVVGYGAMHNFGRTHCKWIQESPNLRLVGVCDGDPARTDAAHADFADIRAYNTTQDVWADPDVQMVTFVTPNFTHCPLACEAFAHGRHVLVENAMCLNSAEATAMVEAADKAGKMLCVHHNRRHDGNYRLIREIIDSGELGEIFHIELCPGQYLHPFKDHLDSWWADKSRSGGGFFYYGAQAFDWILDIIDCPMTGITGFTQKRVWTDMTFDDQVMSIIHFENNAVANFAECHIRSDPKPFWRIRGTKGAIVDSGENATAGYEKEINHLSSGSLQLYTYRDDGSVHEQTLPYKDSDWHMFYRDIAAHLLAGAPVPISGETGRRVIGIMEQSINSADAGHTLPPLFA